jgi:hypothetical protein
MREEESPRGRVIKLTTIVTLDGLDDKAKLYGHPSEEVKSVKNVSDFARKGKVHE